MTSRTCLFAALAGLLPGPLLWASTAGCRSADAVPGGPDFELHEIATGRARAQTVLTGFFLGGPMADLAVVSTGVTGTRQLRLLTWKRGAWVPALDRELGPEVLFVDAARVADRDRLLFYEHGRLTWLDPGLGSRVPLVSVTTGFRSTPDDGVPFLDVTRDANRDGLDDLVVPDLDGFWVSVQRSDGSFTEPEKLGPPEPFLEARGLEDRRPYGEIGVTAATNEAYQSRAHVADFDLDGRSDLVFWSGDHFQVHLQEDDGTFEEEPVSVATDVRFDADGVYSHAFAFEGENELALVTGFRDRTERTALFALRDLNGDGVTDLVTHTLSGRSLIRLKSSLAVHLGEVSSLGLRFEREPSSRLRTRGRQPAGYALQFFEDLDGDGTLEAILFSVDTGLGDAVQAMVANSIDVDLEFYRMENGVYSDEPAYARRIRPEHDLFGSRGPYFPTVLGGDVNGDGYRDLLAGQGWDELHVYLGAPRPELFERRPLEVRVPLPANEKDARIVDLNGDGRDDVLVHHRSPSGPHRVVLLASR